MREAPGIQTQKSGASRSRADHTERRGGVPALFVVRTIERQSQRAMNFQTDNVGINDPENTLNEELRFLATHIP